MAIARKPRNDSASEKDIEALIKKGGSVAESKPSGRTRTGDSKPTSVILRVPPAMLARVDAAVDTRRVPTPRHTWLLEAIVEKLEREESD